MICYSGHYWGQVALAPWELQVILVTIGGAVRETWPAKTEKPSSQRSQNANLVENEPPAGR